MAKAATFKVREARHLGGLGGGCNQTRVRIIDPNDEQGEPAYSDAVPVDNDTPVHDWQAED